MSYQVAADLNGESTTFDEDTRNETIQRLRIVQEHLGELLHQIPGLTVSGWQSSAAESFRRQLEGLREQLLSLESRADSLIVRVCQDFDHAQDAVEVPPLP